jgi:hypothetical protein
MGLQLSGKLVPQHKIHLPGEVEIINGIQKAQSIAVAQLRRLQAEIQIRPWLISPHRPRPEQPDALNLRLCCEHSQESFLRLGRDIQGQGASS